MAREGMGAYGMIRTVEEWIQSRKLSGYQYVVQGTMKHEYTLDKNGEVIRDELSGTPKRRLKNNIIQTRSFVVSEWDEDPLDVQVAVIVHLMNYAHSR